MLFYIPRFSVTDSLNHRHIEISTDNSIHHHYHRRIPAATTTTTQPIQQRPVLNLAGIQQLTKPYRPSAAHTYWNKYSESREKTLLRILGYWNFFLEKISNREGFSSKLVSLLIFTRIMHFYCFSHGGVIWQVLTDVYWWILITARAGSCAISSCHSIVSGIAFESAKNNHPPHRSNRFSINFLSCENIHHYLSISPISINFITRDNFHRHHQNFPITNISSVTINP
jgi:hypothetical protein